MIVNSPTNNKLTARLLIVDDNPGDLKLYEQYLAADTGENYIITTAGNAEEGLKKFTQQDYDCVLLDYMLPDIDGLDLLGYLRKSNHGNVKKPVILLTGQGDERIAARAVRMGVTNYVMKADLNTQTMREAIQHALYKPTQADMSYDNAEIQAAQVKTRHPALEDALTHVVSRALFHDRLLHTTLNASRNRDVFAVLVMEMTNYSHIVGALGDAAGFAMLKDAAERLGQLLRASDTLARIGENRFGIILSRLHSQEDVFIVFERLIAMNGRSFIVGDHKQYMQVAVGGSVFPNHGLEPDVLLGRAEVASHQARMGRGCALAQLLQ